MSLIRHSILRGASRTLLVLAALFGLAVLAVGGHAIWAWRRATADPTSAPSAATPVAEVATAAPSPTASRGVTGRVTPAEPLAAAPTPILPHKVGIVAGHWLSDVGATCPDGLTEVEINVAVAQLVVSMLSRSGYDAEMLAEFSPDLHGYEASALVSIHADSCNVPEATGFKVARVSSSLVPELEDRLVACLIEEYQEATGLPFHRNSITYDMTEYHAFYEIAPETPAAIIEIGFMAADRRLLTKRQDLVAEGIVNGIKNFLDPPQ
ncbi:MAG: N-acetylmuramoyl-L-alanine amidase [Anaerolineae bacterium]|nr:N-acetylmuramoyl-L-alanine amidase [Anaerolineae bacterium]